MPIDIQMNVDRPNCFFILIRIIHCEIPTGLNAKPYHHAFCKLKVSLVLRDILDSQTNRRLGHGRGIFRAIFHHS